MTTFTFFKSYFRSTQLAAVYIRSRDSCYQLALYYIEPFTGIPTYKVNDREFFRQLTKHYSLGKNTFTQQLDQLHSDGELGKTNYVEKVGKISTHYIVIKNLNYYL